MEPPSRDRLRTGARRPLLSRRGASEAAEKVTLGDFRMERVPAVGVEGAGASESGRGWSVPAPAGVWRPSFGVMAGIRVEGPAALDG